MDPLTKPKRMTTRYWAVFVLALGKSVPYDMLRYEACMPATEEESRLMERAMSPSNPARWIVFKRFVIVGADPWPHVSRWHSFGWDCVDEAFKDYDEACQRREAIERLESADWAARAVRADSEKT